MEVSNEVKCDLCGEYFFAEEMVCNWGTTLTCRYCDEQYYDEMNQQEEGYSSDDHEEFWG